MFDLDGTLVDSKRDLTNAVNALLVECGGAVLPEDEVGRMVGDGAAVLIARAFETGGVAKPPDALERFLAIYEQHLTDWTRPYEGVPEVLAALEPRATLGVLTNKPLAASLTVLERLSLATRLRRDLIVGGDGPFPRKPDPAGLRHLMDSAGVTGAETLLVGDSFIDWRTARAAPASICMARYGFGYVGFPAGELGAEDHVIDRPAGLLDL